MLSWQGAILRYSRKLAFDPATLAESAINRAVSLAPADREVAAYLQMHQELQRGIQRQPAPPRSAPTAEPSPAPATVATPQPPAMTADDLKKIVVGMNREELLKVGAPAGRITLSEDGHLIEIYQYSANGTRLATVRLTDGTVSSLQVP
jgi:hypothetical protein